MSENNPLAGYRIAVTADRRSEDQIAAFVRRGAEVIHAPTLKLVAVEDDAPVVADTKAILAVRPDVLLVTTSYGMRRWFDVADTAGLGGQLVSQLERTRILVRGPKARGAVRAAALDDDGMSPDETTRSLVDMVLAGAGADGTGKTIAVQLHGYTDAEQLKRLRAAGYSVLTVAPYHWHKPSAPSKVEQLIGEIFDGSVDALTFTSAPACEALFTFAESMGVQAALVSAMQTEMIVSAVGPVTAEPLIGRSIEPLMPTRYRMGALIKIVCDELTRESRRSMKTSYGLLELRGNSALVDGTQIKLAPSTRNVLRTLMQSQGAVVSKEALAKNGVELGSVDMAISRLRHCLPEPKIIETVIKRGYRITRRAS